MTSLTTSNNIQNLKVKEKCTVTDWDYLIYEGDGYFTKEDQFIVFDYDGLDFVVSFKLSVSGDIMHINGDWWNDSYTEVRITKIDVEIDSMSLDEVELELLTPQFTKSVVELIKNNL